MTTTLNLRRSMFTVDVFFTLGFSKSQRASACYGLVRSSVTVADAQFVGLAVSQIRYTSV